VISDLYDGPGNYRNYRIPDQIKLLKEAIGFMRKVEFDLARALDRRNQNEKYFFSEDPEARAGYQRLMDRYYQSIAGGR